MGRRVGRMRDLRRFSKGELIGLERYDEMVLAIARCQEADELADFYDKAAAVELYAKRARNQQAELRAQDVRLRAAHRRGDC